MVTKSFELLEPELYVNANAAFRQVLTQVLEQGKTNKRIFIDADINPYNLQ